MPLHFLHVAEALGNIVPERMELTDGNLKRFYFAITQRHLSQNARLENLAERVRGDCHVYPPAEIRQGRRFRIDRSGMVLNGESCISQRTDQILDEILGEHHLFQIFGDYCELGAGGHRLAKDDHDSCY